MTVIFKAGLRHARAVFAMVDIITALLHFAKLDPKSPSNATNLNSNTKPM